MATLYSLPLRLWTGDRKIYLGHPVRILTEAVLFIVGSTWSAYELSSASLLFYHCLYNSRHWYGNWVLYNQDPYYDSQSLRPWSYSKFGHNLGVSTGLLTEVTSEFYQDFCCSWRVSVEMNLKVLPRRACPYSEP